MASRGKVRPKSTPRKGKPNAYTQSQPKSKVGTFPGSMGKGGGAVRGGSR